MKRLVQHARWVMSGALATILVAAAVPAIGGWYVATVLTGSMRPTIAPGDVIVAQPLAVDRARPGDIIVFRDPVHANRSLTHRVRSIVVRDGIAQVETRGDANTASERWQAPVGGRVARVRYRLPKLGYVAHVTNSRTDRMLLIVIPAVLLGVMALWRVWRPASDPAHAHG